ncbi:hypothetical protein Pmani_029033 [Petrolisthes manimaculis]|uniref:Mitochondrial ribosomal protein S17 n=1 Tax=Petrolisthes manimaculis TaxID=1843537 RepID=A0AAE1P0W7_9EUCA|nr:hypothetical protein Pmani_029033 [Petrolisthes manimaculis]
MAKSLARSALFVGKCIAHELKGAAKVEVKLLELDENLHMYFPSFQHYFADDPKEECKTGDIVLIRELPKKKTVLITHSVEKMLYKLGDVTDPITGKNVIMSKYRDQIKERNEQFGPGEGDAGGFNYEEAPPRGWQEGKKDFSHRVGYKAWHVFEPGHPLHDDPAAS